VVRSRHDSTAPLVLRLPDAAQSLGVGESTLRKWVGEGKIRTVRFGSSPRSVLGFRVEDLAEFRDRHLVGADQK